MEITLKLAITSDRRLNAIRFDVKDSLGSMVSSASSIVGRKTAKKGNIRTNRTIKRLKMYNTRPVRDEKGKILHEQYHNPTAQLDGRIEPSRNWFGNTRVVGQQDLAKMRGDCQRRTQSKHISGA